MSASGKNKPKCADLLCRKFTGACAQVQHLIGTEGGGIGQREKLNCDPMPETSADTTGSSRAGGPCPVSWIEGRQPRLYVFHPVTGWKLLPGRGGITPIWVDLSEGQFLQRDAAESHQPPTIPAVRESAPHAWRNFVGRQSRWEATTCTSSFWITRLN